MSSASTTAVFDLLSKESKSDKSSKGKPIDSSILASVVAMVQNDPKSIGSVCRKLIEMVSLVSITFISGMIV